MTDYNNTNNNPVDTGAVNTNAQQVNQAQQPENPGQTVPPQAEPQQNPQGIPVGTPTGYPNGNPAGTPQGAPAGTGYQSPQYNTYGQNPVPPQYGYNPNPNSGYSPAGYLYKSRIAAAVLALTVGVFGVHNFYLGFKTKAVIQLVVSIVGSFLVFPILAMEIWAVVEGIMLLIGNEQHRYDGNGMPLRD